MTERELERIGAEANRRWTLDASLIVHRYGRLEPGDPIVLVATASSHREAALDSCAFLIDWLKTKAPFWKLEETPAGECCVDARDADDAAAARWEGGRPSGSTWPAPSRSGEGGSWAGSPGPRSEERRGG